MIKHFSTVASIFALSSVVACASAHSVKEPPRAPRAHASAPAIPESEIVTLGIPPAPSTTVRVTVASASAPSASPAPSSSSGYVTRKEYDAVVGKLREISEQTEINVTVNECVYGRSEAACKKLGAKAPSDAPSPTSAKPAAPKPESREDIARELESRTLHIINAEEDVYILCVEDKIPSESVYRVHVDDYKTDHLVQVGEVKIPGDKKLHRPEVLVDHALLILPGQEVRFVAKKGTTGKHSFKLFFFREAKEGAVAIGWQQVNLKEVPYVGLGLSSFTAGWSYAPDGTTKRHTWFKY